MCSVLIEANYLKDAIPFMDYLKAAQKAGTNFMALCEITKEIYQEKASCGAFFEFLRFPVLSDRTPSSNANDDIVLILPGRKSPKRPIEGSY